MNFVDEAGGPSAEEESAFYEAGVEDNSESRDVFGLGCLTAGDGLGRKAGYRKFQLPACMRRSTNVASHARVRLTGCSKLLILGTHGHPLLRPAYAPPLRRMPARPAALAPAHPCSPAESQQRRTRLLRICIRSCRARSVGGAPPFPGELTAVVLYIWKTHREYRLAVETRR
ncbi:hypothetical protein A0H81_10982 [Grifola frondosa]|uniref:Uncharacterized protein n=1 Tax=Grifola frondosa TaxID=5627 RepID=A0A1C7M2L8_GRIFR|nr:hypothetical protein A0H81_10982 [Grifola frondosa]